jgi:autotransporter-associated beta strand protein
LPTATTVLLGAASGAPTLDLYGSNQQVAALSDNGAYTNGIVTNTGSLATLTLSPTITQTFTGSIQGPITLVVNGSGTQVLAGTNSYTGSTFITGGTLQLGASNALPSTFTPAIGVTADLTVNGGTFDLNGYNQTVNSLSDGGLATGVITNSSLSPSTFTVTPTGTGIFAATFGGNVTGNLTLAMNGTGALVLSGTNSYSAGTTISQGILEFTQTASLPGSGTVSVASGATLAVNLANWGGATDALWNGTNPNIAFTSGGLLGLDAGGATTTYASNITDAGNGTIPMGVTPVGPATVVLSGSNSFTGGVVIIPHAANS